MQSPVSPTPPSNRSRPTRLANPTSPEFIEKLSNGVVAILSPGDGSNARGGYPGWLSGDRSSELPTFLEEAIQKVATQGKAKTLALLTPEHSDGPLQALAEAFEQLYPTLDASNMRQTPASEWPGMLESLPRPGDSHSALIVDQVELLFEQAVDDGERMDFFRILHEVAESSSVSILLVIDRRYLSHCRAIRLLDRSLDQPSHIRLPGPDQPVAIRPHRETPSAQKAFLPVNVAVSSPHLDQPLPQPST